ncbi:MAG: hypothetical protein ACREQN_16565 [Candidatus Binataceae bacterium]
MAANTTAATSKSSQSSTFPPVRTPTSDRRTDLPSSPWQSLPPLMAKVGVTALAGQVLMLDGNPLAGVTQPLGVSVGGIHSSGNANTISGLQGGSLEEGTEISSENPLLPHYRLVRWESAR